MDGIGLGYPVARGGFEPPTARLWAWRATTALPRYERGPPPLHLAPVQRTSHVPTLFWDRSLARCYPPAPRAVHQVTLLATLRPFQLGHRLGPVESFFPQDGAKPGSWWCEKDLNLRGRGSSIPRSSKLSYRTRPPETSCSMVGKDSPWLGGLSLRSSGSSSPRGGGLSNGPRLSSAGLSRLSRAPEVRTNQPEVCWVLAHLPVSHHGLFPAEGLRAVRTARPASFLLLSEPGDANSIHHGTALVP